MGLTNREVAHLWANQSLPSARTKNGNFSFNGSAILSYRTCIARIILNDDGSPRAYLRNGRQYSVTTTNHQNAVNAAVIRSLPTFWFDGEPSSSHERNARWIKATFEEHLKEAALAQHPATRKKHLKLAAPLVDGFNRYVEFFGVTTERLVIPDDLAAFRAAEKRRLAEAEAETRRQQEEYERQNAERLEQWLAGENVHPPYDLRRVHLRAKGDTLETSKGARVPLIDAIGVFKMAGRVRVTGNPVTFEHRGERPKIGDFRLDRIDADGTIHAGCHTILFEEAERLARQLNVLEEEVA